MSEIVIALIGGLVASVGWAVADVLLKSVMGRAGRYTLLVLAQAGNFIMSFSILFFSREVPEFNASFWVIAIFFGGIQFVATVLLYKAYDIGKISIVNPIISGYAIVAAIISFVFFGEEFAFIKLLLAVVIFIGIVFVGFESKENRNRSLKVSVALAVMIMFLYSVFLPPWDRMLDRDGWAFLIIAQRMSIFGFSVILLRAKRIVFKPGKNIVFLGLLSGLANGVGNLGFSLGLEGSSATSLTVAVAASTPGVTILLAYIFLGERLKKWQYLGIAIIVFGLMLGVFA